MCGCAARRVYMGKDLIKDKWQNLYYFDVEERVRG